jgi:hypothetical protein
MRPTAGVFDVMPADVKLRDRAQSIFSVFEGAINIHLDLAALNRILNSVA